MSKPIQPILVDFGKTAKQKTFAAGVDFHPMVLGKCNYKDPFLFMVANPYAERSKQLEDSFGALFYLKSSGLFDDFGAVYDILTVLPEYQETFLLTQQITGRKPKTNAEMLELLNGAKTHSVANMVTSALAFQIFRGQNRQTFIMPYKVTDGNLEFGDPIEYKFPAPIEMFFEEIGNAAPSDVTDTLTKNGIPPQVAESMLASMTPENLQEVTEQTILMCLVKRLHMTVKFVVETKDPGAPTLDPDLPETTQEATEIPDLDFGVFDQE